MEYITLKKRTDILKLGLKDENGNVIKDLTGKEVYLEFDLGDINLPLKYNKCIDAVDTAKKNLKGQFIIIDKKPDQKKGKNRLSVNDEARVKAVKQFYKDMEIAMDMFLGQGGTRKFLNGKSPYWEMWDDIDEMLKPYYDKMHLTLSDMTDRIKEKYKVRESEVLKDD